MTDRAPVERLALIGWGLLGAGLAVWLLGRGAGSTAWLWACCFVPWAALAAAMYRPVRHGFAYAVLGTVGYVIVTVMELVSLPVRQWPAGVAAAAALTAFFMLIPATRRARAEETRERTES